MSSEEIDDATRRTGYRLGEDGKATKALPPTLSDLIRVANERDVACRLLGELSEALDDPATWQRAIEITEQYPHLGLARGLRAALRERSTPDA